MSITCSTLYHSLVRTRARRIFHILDYSAIYLLIAGTNTPFGLVSLRGPLGWFLFGTVWSLAIAGVIFKSLAIGRFAVASATIYLCMGWLAIFAMRPLLHAISWHRLIWLGAGGFAYTAGILFFAFDRLCYFHALWHLCVCLREALRTTSQSCSMLYHPVFERMGRSNCSEVYEVLARSRDESLSEWA